jgi:acyl-CoA dehydrogenase
MQGLGSAPITLSGSDDRRSRYLPRVASGSAVCAFALSEEGAGSDVSALETIAESDGSDYVLSGQKTWISNAGIADFYVIFARTGEEPGAKGLSAFVVDADTPGLEVSERIRVSSPHPLGSLRLSACRVPSSHRLGNGGDGFRIAMATLDVFRSTVAAAALGFSRRALQESVARVREREVFGRPLAEYQMIQQKIADMAATVDAGALLVYRAAWTKDQGAERVTREASIAKMMVTESAQRVIDDAVQIFGGLGVVAGHPVEELYRDIRPLRIYEGTTEIQKIVIAREVLKDNEEGT